jgi:hypothetical protein
MTRAAGAQSTSALAARPRRRFTDRSNALLGGSSIDVLPVADLVDSDSTSFIVNEIDNSEVALPHPVTIGIPGELLRPVRPGIDRQPLNAGYEPFTVRL